MKVVEVPTLWGWWLVLQLGPRDSDPSSMSTSSEQLMPMKTVTFSGTTKREFFQALDMQDFGLPSDALVCKYDVLVVTQVIGAIMDSGCAANLIMSSLGEDNAHWCLWGNVGDRWMVCDALLNRRIETCLSMLCG